MVQSKGFIVIRNFLNESEVHTMNAAFDANMAKLSPAGEPVFEAGHPLSGGRGAAASTTTSCFRQWTSLLEWPKEYSQPFRDLLAHTKLVPYLNTLCVWLVLCGFATKLGSSAPEKSRVANMHTCFDAQVGSWLAIELS